MDAAEIVGLVDSFDDPEDGSARKSKELILDLLEHSPLPFSREQFEPGHITCTALALHPRSDAVLLVHHRRLSRWLLPGGHVEPEDERIWDAARRELLEETGVDVLSTFAVVGLDVHGIPPRRDEPFHLHHDIIVGFQALSENIHGSPETLEVSWCTPEEFDKFALPESIRLSYRRALSERSRWL